MKNSNWKETAELVGIAAIVASLLFVGLQLKQDREAAFAENLAQYNDRLISFSDLVANNREAWTKGLRGEELPEMDRVVFSYIARVHFMDRMNQARRLELLGSDFSYTPRYYAYYLYMYPGLERWFRQDRDKIITFNEGLGRRSENEFSIRALQQLEELKESGAPKPPPDYLVF